MSWILCKASSESLEKKFSFEISFYRLQISSSKEVASQKILVAINVIGSENWWKNYSYAAVALKYDTALISNKVLLRYYFRF